MDISWNCGTTVVDHRPAVRIAGMSARCKGKTLAMKLSEAMRRGIVKSAWGDDDTPDSVGLSMREGTVEERQAAEKKRRDRIEQEHRVLAEQAAIAERAKTAAAIEEMEAMDGFGSF